MVTIQYVLSKIGQKASLLAGGKGERVQTIVIPHGTPEYPALVSLAHVDTNGKATLELHTSCPQVPDGGYRVREYDSPPAVALLLAHEQERRAFVAQREAKYEQAMVDELLADVPSSLIEKSYTYGWRVKAAANSRAEAVGTERLRQAREEADRRNAEDKANAERAKAEQEAEKARKEREKEAAKARKEAEIEAWANQYGSDRLRRCVAEGIECGAIYRSERLNLEYPGWEIDDSSLPSWDEPRNPPTEALELLDKARASLPADWSEEDRKLATLVYWSKEDDDCETHTGYAVTVGSDVLGDLVYGYDGPRD